MSQWINVAASMPDDDVLVLLAISDKEVWPGFRDGDLWRYADAMVVTATVTHYMELPAAPEDE
jgi:hypothetical protein